MSRHTKIVATLGPASSSTEVLERMVGAGIDVVRMNFSHGTTDDHLARANIIREIAGRLGRTVGILGDLQGPKIRVGKFENGKITLVEGEKFILDAGCPLGNQERVGLDYKDLPKDVKSGDILLLDDGRLKLEVGMVRAVRRAGAIRRGDIPRHRHQHDLRFVAGMRQAEDPGVGLRCGVGIEVFHRTHLARPGDSGNGLSPRRYRRP